MTPLHPRSLWGRTTSVLDLPWLPDHHSAVNNLNKPLFAEKVAKPPQSGPVQLRGDDADQLQGERVCPPAPAHLPGWV